MTHLVGGASGLLGGNVVAAARNRGERVRGTYRTEDPPGTSESGTGPGTGTFADEGVETVRFDVTGRTDVDRPSILAGGDRVIDCAAVTDVSKRERERGRDAPTLDEDLDAVERAGLL